MSFLPINPRSFSFKFVRPRENTRSDSQLYSTRFTAVGYMEGTIRVPKMPSTDLDTDGKRKLSKLMAALALADRPAGFFYADLVLPHQSDFPTPVWVDANASSSVEQLGFDQSLGIEPGDIVSVRSTAAGVLSYVTARIATAVNDSTHAVDLNHPLPYEFLPDAAARVQVCVNRPHVRAIFSDEVAQWSVDYNRMASISVLNWKEDTAGIIAALRAQDNSTPVTPPPNPGDGYITLENGIPLGLEDGSGAITLEP